MLPGVSLTVKGPSTSPINVTVGGTDTNLMATAIAFVDGYNRLHDKLDDLTAFDAETSTGSLLFGDSTTLRLESDLADLLSGAIGGVGSIRSLETIGISLNERRQARSSIRPSSRPKFAADPAAVQSFFSTDNLGFADRFDQLVEQLAGEENSLLSSRLSALDRKVLDNQQPDRRVERAGSIAHASGWCCSSRSWRRPSAASKAT